MTRTQPTLGDFLGVLTALAARGDTLRDLDTGLVIPPDAGAAQISAAGDAFERAMRRIGSHGRTGGQVSGERRSAVAQAACDAMRPYWPLPSSEYPTAALCKRFGVSRPTAILYLGPRQPLQRKHDADARASACQHRQGADNASA